MRVRVSRRGGVVDVDEVTELEDGTARALRTGGEVAAERELAEDVSAKIADLARRCRSQTVTRDPAQRAALSDGMGTTVEVDDGEGDEPVTFAFESGDDVPEEITQLVSAVLAAPFRDPGTPVKRR